MTPNGWRTITFGDAASLAYGKSLPAAQRKNGVVPVCGSNGIIGFHDEPLARGPGIIVGRKGSVGAVTWVDKDFWPIDTTYYVKSKEPSDARWLYYAVSNLGLDKLNEATGIPGLNRSTAAAVTFYVPPLPEQRKIAAILSSLDDAIEKTQAVIDQVQVVKRGLLQELLTQGLPGRHTRFKQTEIGPIPQDWQLKRLSEVASIQTGLAKNKANAGALSVSYLRVANVQDGFVDLAEVKVVEVNTDALPRYALRRGDVLFTEGGDADKLGRGAVWNGEIEPCLHQNHVFVARPLGNIRPMFLSLYRGSSRGKSYFLNCSKQTTNLASMNSTQLKNLPLPIPQLDEQDRIVECLGAFDDRLSQERDCLKELERLKSALMSMLLTGELRVTPDIECA